MDLIKVAEQAFAGGKAAEFPEFKAGDTITVTYRKETRSATRSSAVSLSR